MSAPVDRIAPTEATAVPTGREASGESTIGAGLLLVLALLSALAPFATDLYLPAFPRMTTDLGASATAVQLTLTAFLAGITLGQLAFGTLSDRFGRVRPLVVGAVLCVAASALAATAPSIEILTAARFAQGFTGAAGMVIGRAIISDLASGKAAARAFSLMMIVGGIAPVLAPFAGSLLVDPIGWRGILWAVFALALTMFVATALVVRESHTSERRAALKSEGSGAATGFGALRSRIYVGNAFAFAFAFSVMMAYISASPFVYQVMIGMNPVQYGIAFGVNALGLAAVSALSAKLTSSTPARTMLGVGIGLVFAATVVLLGLVVLGAPTWSLPIPIFVAVASLGLVLGNATALALGAVPQAAGTGSAVLGALQFGLAALVSPLVNLGGETSALPLAIVMVALAAIALGACAIGGDRTGLPADTRA
jgi:DHA1 family bicyclomycin/chloramphenicol resistance-like MFS transporter